MQLQLLATTQIEIVGWRSVQRSARGQLHEFINARQHVPPKALEHFALSAEGRLWQIMTLTED
jgi:hypothetical protein